MLELVAAILIIFPRINRPNWHIWCSLNVCFFLFGGWGTGPPVLPPLWLGYAIGVLV